MVIKVKKFSTLHGFTLIELLVAIAIVGILAAASIALLNPSEQFKKSRDAQRKHDLSQIQIALQAYEADNNRFPNLYALFAPDDPWGKPWLPYMVKIPKDPISPNQYYYYQLAEDASWYMLYARLEHCPDPQMIPGTDCTYFNYAVASPNIAVAPLPTPPPMPTPTSEPTPTSTPAIKYVFVTSQTYSGDLKTAGTLPSYPDPSNSLNPGLQGADNICKSLAESSPLLNPNLKNRTWNAWLSTSSVNAKDRIPDAEYRLVDNTTVVANNKVDLLNGINYPIDRNESNGQINSNFSVWTGTQNNGTAFGPNCNGWTDTNSSGLVGLSSSTASWTSNSNGEDNCAGFTTTRLYCFEQ